ncbi:unnamed protein product, partial [Prorocentrum cordatum]
MSFADSLTRIVAEKRAEQAEKERIAAKWHSHEEKLLEQAVDLFKQRCTREAESGEKCTATVSFEVLSREISGHFPKRVLTDSTYFVESWGEGIKAENWFYAVRGAAASWSPGAPILFAEVLQGMLPKFVEKVKALGFNSCVHEQGTWKITVTWDLPEGDEESRTAPPRRREGRQAAAWPALPAARPRRPPHFSGSVPSLFPRASSSEPARYTVCLWGRAATYLYWSSPLWLRARSK